MEEATSAASERSMVQALVFDVGETLVNESRLWRLWAAWLKVPEHVLFAVLGATIEGGEHYRRVFEILRPGFCLEAAREEREKAGIPDRFNASDLYSDVALCLAALRKRGLRIGIAGNQPMGFEKAFEELGLTVDLMGSSTAWNVEKPSPGFFQRIADELRLPPPAIAYVGDRLDNDILPALGAGMVAVFIKRGPWGFLHAQKQGIEKAHIRIDDLTALPQALDRLPDLKPAF